MSKHPGKGKKLCKNCQTLCAAAIKACPECKTEFVVVKPGMPEIPKGKKITIVPQGYGTYRIISTIHTPAGHCPIKLKQNPTEDDILDWADNVRVHFLKRNEWLMNHALCYYLRYDYDPFSEEYAKLTNIINSIPDIEHHYIEEKDE